MLLKGLISSIFFVVCTHLFCTIQIVDNNARVPVHGDFEYFEDVSNSISLDSIQKCSFQKSLKNDPSFGLTSSTYWIRFEVNIHCRNEDLYKLEISNTLIDEIELFTCLDNKVKSQRTGRAFNFSDRKYSFKSFVFDLENNGKDQTYYLKVKSLYTLAFPIEFAPFSRINASENNRQLLYGFIFGLMLIVALYNFLMYYFVKENASLLYGFYILVFGFYNLIFVGLDVQYFYSNSIEWPKISASVFASFSVFLACAFTRQFLNTKEYVKRADMALMLMMFVAVVLFIIPFFDISILYKKIITLFPVVIFVPIIYAAVIRKKQGFVPSKLFIYGWSFLGLGILLYGLRSSEIIESNVFTANSIPIGAVAEMIVLSISVTYKFKVIKDENDKSKEDKIIHLQEMEALKDKVNRELEQKVEERTKEVLAQKDELSVKNQHITDSINYAKKIQVSILPDSVQINARFKDFFVFYKPKDIVSGDFYWFSADEERILIAAADCTGHGVPGALMSILGQSYLGDIVGDKKVDDTGSILDQLHEKVTGTLRQSEKGMSVHDGMDIALAKITFNPLTLEYAGAKRPLWLFKNGELKVIKGSRFPIGGMQYNLRDKYYSQTLKLEVGDTFYMFSDGYADQFGGEDGKKYMIKNFKNLLHEIQDLPMIEQNKIIKDEFYSWKGDFEQVDDILVIGAKV